MDATFQSLGFWLLTALFGVATTAFGAIYNGLVKKIDNLRTDFEENRRCVDNRLEFLTLELTKVNERVVSKTELKEAISEAVQQEFLKWENKLFHDGKLQPGVKRQRGD